jgi:hypothetical protein
MGSYRQMRDSLGRKPGKTYPIDAKECQRFAQASYLRGVHMN